MPNNQFELWKKKMKLAGKEKRIPVCGQFELTPRCNFDCKMCYIHNQDSNSMKSRELTTQQWKRIFDEAYDAGMMFATLTGGECLLRDDFKELYLHLWNKRVNITVLTNGYLIDDAYVAFFSEYKPDRIRISLYGSNEDGYRRVTGHTGFARVTENLKKLKDSGLKPQVTVTPSKPGMDDYADTIKFVSQHGFNLKLSEMVLLGKRDDPDNVEHFLSLDDIINLSVQRTQLLASLTPTDVTPEPCGKCKEAPCGLTCNAGNGLVYVTWEGKVYPCASAMIGEGYSLLEMSFAEAWEKNKAVADAAVLGMECVDCPYDAVCPKCPGMRLKDFESGHCNPEVCEMTRRLVAAGVKKLKQSEEI